jgi:flagellar basal body-associated protein FliL
MKKIKEPSSRRLLILYRVLALLTLALGLLIIGGTLYALLRGPDSAPLFSFIPSGRSSGGAPGKNRVQITAQGADGSDTSVFTGIGRLRIPVAGQTSAPAATMVLSIAFPYPLRDRPFTEELAAKVGDFRTLAQDYFSALSAEEIRNLNEEKAKTEILRAYNRILRLGRIEALYFNDLMVLE